LTSSAPRLFRGIRMKKFSKIDIKAKITNSIVERLEQGGIPPWRCPWTKTDVSPIPVNFLNKKPYSGLNILLLWMAATDGDYSDNSWLTFKQAKELGGNIRKGEKGVSCIFYKHVQVGEKSTNDEDAESYHMLKSFTLFNIAQVEGLEVSEVITESLEISEEQEDQACNDFISRAIQYCDEQGIVIKEGGNQAYYSPTLDLVKMPTTFENVVAYASTLAHELSHSTGHKKRLDRFDEFKNEFNKKIESYGFEELVAEISSVFMCSSFGIELDFNQHISYLDSWLKNMKADKSFIFKASSHAFKAYSYFMDDGSETVLTKAA